MKNLLPPQLDAAAIFTQVKMNSRDLEKKRRLSELESSVIRRYTVYESYTKKLEEISGSNITDKEDKEALESCYVRSKQGYLEGEVVAKIIKAQSAQHKNTCPYCGMDKPRTIDHYLPKSIFPEFSIYPPNLIPCCGHCNTKKGKKWLKKGARRFINFYYDDLPDVKFLFAELVFEQDKRIHEPRVTFTLVQNDAVPTEQFRLINSHYIELNLLQELSEYVEEEISNIYDEVIHNTNLRIEEHKENLKMKQSSYIRKYGHNYWRSALYDAIIDSDEFFNRIYEL
ncbi:HNH endonuclease [Paenibacillus favisporus]|uniref:HNH endonuclease n=1 Tax=Paenibacillus favisporus TaxID=221028 RepID=UPI003D2AD5F4